MQNKVFKLAFCAVLILISCTMIYPQMIAATMKVFLQGEAKGGTLTFSKTAGCPYVEIQTKPGEKAESVIKRIAEQLNNENSECYKSYGSVEPEGQSLIIGGFPRPGTWCFGGTETALGIPAAPKSVSARYDKKEKKAYISWENPDGGYEKIGLAQFSERKSNIGLDGRKTTYTYNASDIFFSPDIDMEFYIGGENKGVPSNAAGIYICDYNTQISLMNVPFTGGIAPNFYTWSYKTDIKAITYRQGTHPGGGPQKALEQLDYKCFYQVIEAYGTFRGGMLRKFFQIQPGHTYRVSARMNTFDTPAGTWTFSLHAAYCTGKGLTAEQMAGVSDLPNGKKGLDSSCIAEYGKEALTVGKWIFASTGTKSSGKMIGDITMPEKGADCIAVWLRVTGEDAKKVKAGFDFVCVEDLDERDPKQYYPPEKERF